MTDHTVRITATMTVHNRKNQTLRCIQSLTDQVGLNKSFRVETIVVDDGSTDGTAHAIAKSFPSLSVRILQGDGTLYWARGMALAQSQISRSDADYVLWLNDDVILKPDAISLLISQALNPRQSVIVVGAVEDNGSVTYTGARLLSLRPTHLQPVPPNGLLQEVDAFNGNVVLVTRAAFECLGPVDASFEHAYGDNDYGLRARALGVRVLLAPWTVGFCSRNTKDGTWQDSSLGRGTRTLLLFSVRGFPVRSHFLYNIRHAGVLRGSLYATAQYASALFRIWLCPRR